MRLQGQDILRQDGLTALGSNEKHKNGTSLCSY
jgi:hypothetical protein